MASVALMVYSTSGSISTERRFPTDLTISELKNKLELIVGTPAAFQNLHLRTEDDAPVAALDDGSKSLSAYGALNGMRLQVVDKDPNQTAQQLNDLSQVEKVEMKEEDYEKREDSVRAFKRRMKLGRFADDGSEQVDELAVDREAAAGMKVGDRCKVEKPTRYGSVMFIGETQFKPGCLWIGVKLDEPLGKNNGSVNGVQYFECDDKYGVFQRPKVVTVGDFPEENFEDEEL
ncbi:tubulin-folding cofactor B-like [Sycon ciliatum]|uniref:tubulin-folding cofactor B-like n=1 Tax=Sycon ciliatum TaxID=27933 RepID=UPI0020A8A2CB|eukprot:scpid84122/ scgid19989/ Tubulin-folding cofactor B; Cytoskeleton-associated protein 1; Cytoskeleton-associated protein CKAPI; Tubulin-specific chaperone B